MKTCGCGKVYTRAGWLKLTRLGLQDSGIYELEMRNCERCGSTLAVPTRQLMATKQKNLTVLVVEFDEKRGGEATTRVANINGDDLHAMQGIVDGLIQGVALPHLGMTLWCNEDGALMPEKWPPHTTELAPFPVFGNFFLCRGSPRGDMKSLTPDDIRDLKLILSDGYEDADEMSETRKAGLSRGQP